MTIFNLILVLGLKIIFVDSVNSYCNVPTDVLVGGCHIENRIYLALNSEERDKYEHRDISEVMYHEVGHDPLIQDNKEVRALISKYPAPRFYSRKSYPSDSQQLNEKIADYFAMKIKYSDFPKKFPEINALFNKITSDIINNK